MNTVPLAHADTLYAVARDAQVKRHRVVHPALSELAIAIGRLRGALREELEDPFWIDVIRYLRVFMFVISGTPLPLNDPALGLGPMVDRLLDRVGPIEDTHPPYAAFVRETIDRMIMVGRSGDDQLGDAIRAELKDTRGDVLVLLRKAARVAAVQERLTVSAGARIHVGTSQLLAQEEVYQRIVAVGPSRWFMEALGAPRAPLVDLFRFSWVRDQSTPAPLLVGSRSRPRGLNGTGPQVEEERSEADDLPEDFLEPRVAWSQIHERVLKAASEEGQASEEVEARLFLLADSHAVYVEAEEGAKSYVLDPTAELDERVVLLPADELTAGMFLILRTEGADDRTALADRIMGARANVLRERQRMWKERLREQIRASGPDAVVRRLREAGSARASRANLRNWAASRSIRTRDYVDFLAIMRVIDQESEAPGIWEEMASIASAHRQAGQHVRAVLIRRMEKADLTGLDAEGRVDFEAPDLGGGTLTVFRVEEVAPEPLLIPENRVDRPFPLEAELWHG